MEERMEQLICENITKNYKSKDALDSVNLTLAKGKIYGLIGRNGAGQNDASVHLKRPESAE